MGMMNRLPFWDRGTGLHAQANAAAAESAAKMRSEARIELEETPKKRVRPTAADKRQSALARFLERDRSVVVVRTGPQPERHLRHLVGEIRGTAAGAIEETMALNSGLILWALHEAGLPDDRPRRFREADDVAERELIPLW